MSRQAGDTELAAVTKSLMTVRREKPPLHLVCTEGLCGIISKVFYLLSNVLQLRLLVKMWHHRKGILFTIQCIAVTASCQDVASSQRYSIHYPMYCSYGFLTRCHIVFITRNVVFVEIKIGQYEYRVL